MSKNQITNCLGDIMRVLYVSLDLTVPPRDSGLDRELCQRIFSKKQYCNAFGF